MCPDCEQGDHWNCDGQEHTDTEHFVMVSVCCCGIIIEGGYLRAATH